MNYIGEINEFHRRRISFPLSVRAIAIWFLMMDAANASRWRFPLRLSELEIRGSCEMGHEAFLNARKELVEGGYIQYQSQGSRRKPKYTVVSYCYKEASK